ncbi:MAG: ribosome maturation factor RimP [Clostridiales bacterium]|nr:ribosome maturation factor RimP [Clostridiales bacterium]
MANEAEKLAFEVGDEVAETMGYALVDAQFKKEGKDRYLRLFIDKDGGVGIDDCEKFSRAFETEYDRRDPIDGGYILEVSSPGLDRKLKTEREFKHYIGRIVDVKLFKESDAGKEFSGTLTGFDGKTVSIECEGRNVNINPKEAAYIRLHFEI